MHISFTQGIVSMAVLAVVASCIVFFVNLQRSESRLSGWTAVAVGFALVGLLLGNDGLIGYGFICMGMLLAAAQMLARVRRE